MQLRFVPASKTALSYLLCSIPAGGGFSQALIPCPPQWTGSRKSLGSPSVARASQLAVASGGASICAGARVTGAHGWLISALRPGVPAARRCRHWGSSGERCRSVTDGSAPVLLACCLYVQGGAPGSLDRCCAATLHTRQLHLFAHDCGCSNVAAVADSTRAAACLCSRPAGLVLQNNCHTWHRTPVCLTQTHGSTTAGAARVPSNHRGLVELGVLSCVHTMP